METTPHTPPVRKRLGCFGLMAFVFAIAMIISGIVAWKFLNESSAVANRGVDLLESLPLKFQSQHITETFRESVTHIEPTHGDVLELATLEADETITKFDMKTLFNDTLYLGTTVSEIRVPAVYRYHLKISEDWKLNASGNVITVVAPVIRPTLPPAIRTERMEKKSESGWLRFNKQANLAALEKNLTPTLERRAGSPGKLKQVREPCRRSVAEFVKRWLLKEQQWKPESFAAIVVVFADEPEAKNIEKLTTLPATLNL